MTTRRHGAPSAHRVRRRYGATMMVMALGGLACRARAVGAPLLTSIAPAQVSIGGGTAPTVTVRGRGFATVNTVHFGKLRIPDVPSMNDSVMEFAVPTDDTFLPDRGPVPVQALASGTYEVRVQNARGMSNALTIALTAGGAAR